MAENKMEQVAAMFGKQLGERFIVERDYGRFDCEFAACGFVTYGFVTYGAYENPYLNFDDLILEDLLTGRAVIINE